MELQDRVTVTLTEHGAKKLNECNKYFNDRCPKLKPFKTDYKAGDEVTDCLHEIINRFEGQFSVGSDVCFRNLRPADTPTSKSENVKQEKDDRSGMFSKKGQFYDHDICITLNGFSFIHDLDALENICFPVIPSDQAVFMQNNVVSLTTYDMLANAYVAAMDEIAMLRAKLKRIQEVIKDEQ
ncbi:hypothetical protein [Butyricimonas faecihominis]|uniref:hypothetical protein n=1 Tax=Butyricimonas faecihominis TaxID=1472416 RepID=UPI0026DC21A9|nr:hypothetical protein [Butyricimonas faecihominis]